MADFIYDARLPLPRVINGKFPLGSRGFEASAICRQLAAFFFCESVASEFNFPESSSCNRFNRSRAASSHLMDVLLMSHWQQPGEKRESYLSLLIRTRQLALRMSGDLDVERGQAGSSSSKSINSEFDCVLRDPVGAACSRKIDYATKFSLQPASSASPKADSREKRTSKVDLM